MTASPGHARTTAGFLSPSSRSVKDRQARHVLLRCDRCRVTTEADVHVDGNGIVTAAWDVGVIAVVRTARADHLAEVEMARRAFVESQRREPYGDSDRTKELRRAFKDLQQNPPKSKVTAIVHGGCNGRFRVYDTKAKA